jgi:hypothetical protein
MRMKFPLGSKADIAARLGDVCSTPKKQTLNGAARPIGALWTAMPSHPCYSAGERACFSRHFGPGPRM